MVAARYMPVVVAGLILIGGSAAVAGSQSVLDPYNQVQAPGGSGGKGKGARPAAEPGNDPLDVSTTSTYVTMPMGENHEESAKAEEPSKLGGMFSGVSGLTEPFKNAGAKMAEGSKAVGSSVANGTKKIGSTIAGGAKASGECFMKGARAIGGGLKATGDKLKDGTQAIGGKVADLPHAIGHKKDKDAPPEAATPQVADKVVPQTQAPSTGEESIEDLPTPTAAAPVADDVATPKSSDSGALPLHEQPKKVAENEGNFFSRTLGKFKGKKTAENPSQDQPTATAGKESDNPM